MRQNEKQPNREVSAFESMQWEMGKRRETEEERVSDWPQRSRQRCAQHVNTNTKSLKGFHPGEISARLRSQAFVTALERKWTGGGRGKAYQISTFARAYRAIESHFHLFSSAILCDIKTSQGPYTSPSHSAYSCSHILGLLFTYSNNVPTLSVTISSSFVSVGREIALPSHPSPAPAASIIVYCLGPRFPEGTRGTHWVFMRV